MAGPRARNEPVCGRFSGRAARNSVKFRFASAINGHASPNGIQHSRRTQRKLFQKSRQMSRLCRLHCECHQFFGLFRYAQVRLCPCALARGSMRRSCLYSAHRRQVGVRRLKLRGAAQSNPTGESQSQSIAGQHRVAKSPTAAALPILSASQPETSARGVPSA